MSSTADSGRRLRDELFASVEERKSGWLRVETYVWEGTAVNASAWRADRARQANSEILTMLLLQ